MADYRFLTTWVVDAPIERVWDVIYAVERWPEWWPGVQHVTELFHAVGGLDGTGTFRLFEGPLGTAVTYDWAVRTTKTWMNVIAPSHARCSPGITTR